jgi:hypothetical protein
MRKVYNYDNATIIIVNTNVCTTDKFKKSTEIFMKKVIKERSVYGNRDKTRSIEEK